MSVLSYFRNKITQESYSTLLSDEQLLDLLNQKLRNGELIELFITNPLNIIEEKIKLLKKIPFYKAESSYVESMIINYKSAKIFNLEELAIVSQKIELLTAYINDLYLKTVDKKKTYVKIEPSLKKIDVILEKDIPIYLKNQCLILKKKLKKALDNNTFKSGEVESLISEVEDLLKEYTYNNEESYDKYRQKYKIKLTRVSTAITIVAFIFSSYKVSSWVVDNNNIKKEINRIDSVVNVKYFEEDNEYKNYIFDINFNELSKVNNDTVGYIKVRGTNIDYPIVQSKDNEYYLKHSFEKKYNEAGWIFLDFRNDIDNLSKNNIIYAHGRLDGTMFGSLRKSLNKEWYENNDNHIITIVDKNKTTLWEVFSIYKIKTENYYITTEFSNIEYLEFIRTIKNRSIYDFNNEVTINDKILTLSTCYDELEKVVLHAKMVKAIYK